MGSPLPSAILTLEEASRALRVSSKTLWRLLKNNQLPAFRVGAIWRIRQSDLDAWIQTEVARSAQISFQPYLVNPTPEADLEPISSLSPQVNHRFTFVDMFAGCGGLSLGLSQAGWTGIMAVENDSMAFDTLKHNLIEKRGLFPLWPQIPKEPLDIHEFLRNKQLRTALLEARHEVTLLAGGPPCQGFSVAGARNGMDDRNELAGAFLKCVEFLKPPLVLIENVEGMDRAFKSKPRESTASVADELKARVRDHLGYVPFSEVVQASDFGVPQTRGRLFIFGVRKDLAAGVPESDLNLFAQMYRIRGALLASKNLPADRSVTVLEALCDLSSVDTVDCPDANGFKSGRYLPAISQYGKIMRADVPDDSVPDSHRFPNHTPTVKARYELFQRSLQWGRVSRKTLKENGTAKHRVVYMDPAKTAPTICTSPDDFLHFQQPRIITVREMARLQSFPDDFQFRGRYTINGPRRRYDRARVSQAGNAVPPFVAEAIGHALALVIEAIEKKHGQLDKTRDLCRSSRT